MRPAPIPSGGNPSVPAIDDVGAQAPQRVDEIADRPLVHARRRPTPDTARRENARAAVSGRTAVPALPRNRSADFTGNGPPAPVTR